jgi:Uma2 family endonuclease
MSRVDAPVQKVESEAAYLLLENTALERHEFVDGQMFLMAGGTVQHAKIALRLAAKLLAAAEDTDCEVVSANVRLQIADVYYYPDVMLSCQEDKLERRFFKHPCLIVEVLSDSTALIDREEKWQRYRTIPSLKMYVLLSQDEARAETFSRNPDGTWLYTVLEHDDLLKLPCVDLSVPVSSLYRGVR